MYTAILFEAGYCGELALLKAAELGINSCWVGMTYSKGFVRAEGADKIFAVIALGYGDNNGIPHNSKPIEKLCSCRGEPQWFMRVLLQVGRQAGDGTGRRRCGNCP